MPNTLHLSVLYGYQNKQRLLPYTALTDWFFITEVECLLRGTHLVYNTGFFLTGLNDYVLMIQDGSNMTGTVCGLFTHKSVPVIFEPPCT